MVCYAITVARTAPERIPARTRILTYVVWETAVFALNILAVRQEFTAHLADERAGADAGQGAPSPHSEIHRGALQAARQAVLAMRANDEIGDDAFHRIEEELDWLEMAGDTHVREPRRANAAVVARWLTRRTSRARLPGYLRSDQPGWTIL
jgi:hypothetical protein